jgi:nucleoside diphosphate kinase
MDAPKAGFDFHAGPCALQGKSFFPELVEYMTSGPVYAYVLARVDAIRAWRQLMCVGPLSKPRGAALICACACSLKR